MMNILTITTILINLVLINTFSIKNHSYLSNHHKSKISLNMIQSSNELKTFEPILSPEQLLSFGLITISLVIVTNYWWSVVIPAKRTEVAISKNKGEIKEYLESIRDNDDKNLEQWFFTDWLKKNNKKEAAIPFLKKAKWNSGDNPVLVAFSGIFLLVLIASFGDRL